MSTERPQLQLGPSPWVSAASAAGARCTGKASPALTLLGKLLSKEPSFLPIAGVFPLWEPTVLGGGPRPKTRASHHPCPSPLCSQLPVPCYLCIFDTQITLNELCGVICIHMRIK